MNNDTQIAVTDLVEAFKETIAEQAHVIAVLKATIAAMEREHAENDRVK